MKTDTIQNGIRSLLPFALLCLIPAAIRASESLSVVAGGFAESVNIHLGETSQNKTIKIGNFRATHDPNDNVYGTRIAIALQRELERFEIKIDKNAQKTIEGEFTVDTKKNVVKVNAYIVEVSGKSEQALPIDLRINNTQNSNESSATDVPPAPAVEPSVAGNPLAEAIEREVLEIKQAEIKDPGELLFASGETSGGSITIDSQHYLVFDNRLGIRLKEIRPTVARNSPNFLGPMAVPLSTKAPHFRLRRNASYIIELKNFKNDIDLATKILFDGIDTTVFSEKEADKENLLWLVPMNKNVALYGWFRNDRESHAFQLVPDEKSVAHQFKNESHKGRIQVNIYAAWDPERRASVPLSFQNYGTRSAVGQGVAFSNAVKRTKVETGALLGELVVEYVDDVTNDPLAAR